MGTDESSTAVQTTVLQNRWEYTRDLGGNEPAPLAPKATGSNEVATAQATEPAADAGGDLGNIASAQASSEPHGSKVAVAEICATLYRRSVTQEEVADAQGRFAFREEADFAIVDEVANALAQSCCVVFDEDIDDMTEADCDRMMSSGVMTVTGSSWHSDL